MWGRGMGISCDGGAGQEGESMYFITCGSLYIRYEVLGKSSAKVLFVGSERQAGFAMQPCQKR